MSFTSFFHKINLVYTLSNNFQIFSNFFVLCEMSRYFGKCFGPSTRVPKFWAQMPQLFIIKICITIKVNSICSVGWDARNLCHKFSSQGPALRILGLRVRSPKFQGPSPRVLGVRVPCLSVPRPRVPEPQVPGLRVPRFRVSGSQSLRVPGLRVSVPGSQILILDYAIFERFSLILSKS